MCSRKHAAVTTLLRLVQAAECALNETRENLSERIDKHRLSHPSVGLRRTAGKQIPVALLIA